MRLELTKGCEASCRDEAGARAFCRVSTRDSDTPSYWEMKDEPAFKTLQGNPALFQLRASCCPFHLRQQIQCPSQIPIAEIKSHIEVHFESWHSSQVEAGNQV